MKKVKIINLDNDVFEANLVEDKNFVGGKKLEFINNDGVVCVYSINLVKILEDEYSGFTRS